LNPVSSSESRPLQDPDDWFAESDWAGDQSSPALRDDVQPFERRRPLADFTVTVRALLVAAAVLVLGVVLIALAVAGVFSGSSRQQSTSPPPATHTTPTATTPTTTAAPPPRIVVPASTLKPGDTGAQVKRLQRALAQLGYKPGAVDGDYGPSTVEAVKQFQQASKLTADGIVGPATLRALRRAA
jgi:hypothetical protein